MPPPPRGRGSRLAGLLDEPVADPLRSRRRLARSARALAGSGSAFLLLGPAVDSGSLVLTTAGAGAILTSAALYAVRARRGHPYPHLGRALAAWQRAGATPRQLRILDEAHRLRAATPPVGYRDRRTVVDPLADAYAIFTSPAWRDPWLADRQLVIDPVVEAAEVLDYLHRVTGLLQEVRDHLRTLPPTSPAHRTYQGHEQALLRSLDDGLRRARALTDYRAQVRRLEDVLAGSRALAEAETFGDRILDVVAESARHEHAVRHLDESRDQLQMLESGLREITDLLGTAPSLPAPPQH